jgi:hypothetical protein
MSEHTLQFLPSASALDFEWSYHASSPTPAINHVRPFRVATPQPPHVFREIEPRLPSLSLQDDRYSIKRHQATLFSGNEQTILLTGASDVPDQLFMNSRMLDIFGALDFSRLEAAILNYLKYCEKASPSCRIQAPQTGIFPGMKITNTDAKTRLDGQKSITRNRDLWFKN